MSIETIRLDKWLWYARFFKSRSLASKLCKSGKVRINGELTKKTHQSIRRGDVLTFSLGSNVRIIRIIGLGDRRGPAKEAQRLYEDLQPPSRLHDKHDLAHVVSVQRDPGSGRPTKNQRRAIDRLMGWFKGR